MKGSQKVIDALNDGLTIELTAINLYFISSKMCSLRLENDDSKRRTAPAATGGWAARQRSSTDRRAKMLETFQFDFKASFFETVL